MAACPVIIPFGMAPRWENPNLPLVLKRDPQKGGAHESIQDVHVEMVARRLVQMGDAGLGNCDRSLLARFF